MYTALQDIKVQMPDGSIETRTPGQPVPEAADWSNVQRYVAQGRLAADSGTIVPALHRSKSHNLAVDPDGNPIDDVPLYTVKRNLAKANDRKLEKLCSTYSLNPADFKGRDAIRKALVPLIMAANEASDKGAADRKRKAAQAKAARRPHKALSHLPSPEEEAKLAAAAKAKEKADFDLAVQKEAELADAKAKAQENLAGAQVVDDDPDPELLSDGDNPIPSADQLLNATAADLGKMKNAELKAYASEKGIDLGEATKHDDMVKAILEVQG